MDIGTRGRFMALLKSGGEWGDFVEKFWQIEVGPSVVMTALSGGKLNKLKF